MQELNCLVTGASSGIGKEISLELSKIAKHIYITSRNVNALEEVHDQIVLNSCKCTIVPLDLCEEMGIENLAEEILRKDQHLDILILSAGIIRDLSPIDSINLEKLKEILNLNYLANFRMIKSFHPLLKNSKNANLGVISSIKDLSKNKYWGIYQPIMTALNELLLMYADENKNTSIKVNIFNPIAVNTKFRDTIMPGEDKTKISSPQKVAIKIIQHILKTKNTGKFVEIT